jgi:hypothetical protein
LTKSNRTGIINLITNSILLVKTNRKEHTATSTKNNRFTSPYLIMVEIEAKDKIFLPFFTTRKWCLLALDLPFEKIL